MLREDSRTEDARDDAARSSAKESDREVKFFASLEPVSRFDLLDWDRSTQGLQSLLISLHAANP